MLQVSRGTEWSLHAGKSGSDVAAAAAAAAASSGGGVSSAAAAAAAAASSQGTFFCQTDSACLHISQMCCAKSDKELQIACACEEPF